MRTYEWSEIEQLAEEVADMDRLTAISHITDYIDQRDEVINYDRINWCDRYVNAIQGGYDMKGAVGVANDAVTVCYEY